MPPSENSRIDEQPLTQDQIDSFKANGYLVLPGFVADDVVAQWREQFWGYLGCTLDEPDKWPEKTD